MRKMKDSGIPYAQQIPTTWNLIPNRYLFEYHSKKVGSESSKYQLLSLTTQGVKERDITAVGGKVPESYDTYQTVEKGDMIFCLFDLDCSAVFSGLSDYEGMITSAYDVMRPNAKIFDSLYSRYWFSYVFSKRYYMMYSQNLRYTITSSIFNSIKTPCPPIEEQHKIGVFLDRKCSEIDSIVRDTEKTIEEYKKLKQSLITEVVTGKKRVAADGLSLSNESRKMKDSGVEWIGEVPEEWGVKRFKEIAAVKANLVHPYNFLDYPQIAPDNIEKGSAKLLPWKSVKDSNVISDNHLFKKGQIIYSKIRPTLNKLIIAPFDGLCSADMYPIETINHINYMKYSMLSNMFVAQVDIVVHDRVKMPKINQNELSVLYLTVPPKEEQNLIATYLDAKCTEIDKLVADKQTLLQELDTYKKSLIYECVTGKREVN